MGEHPAIVRRARVSKRKRDFARELRQRATDAERRAWEVLRDRRCLGLKFRRQQVIRGFIVDFYCAELRLAIELDGAAHEDPEHMFRDSVRDMVLASEAEVLVVAIPNALVSEERVRTLLQVVRNARHLPLSLKGEGAGG